MKVYNYAETLAMLNEVADEMGCDTLYRDLRAADMPDVSESCYNAHKRSDGTFVPGCIVGQVVVKKLGVPALKLWDGKWGMLSVSRMGARDLAEWLSSEDVRFTFKALELLRIVQVEQDSDTPWGEAIDQAVEWVTAHPHLDDDK